MLLREGGWLLVEAFFASFNFFAFLAFSFSFAFASFSLFSLARSSAAE